MDYLSNNWLTVSEVMEAVTIKGGTTHPSRKAVVAWCNQSVTAFDENEAPILRMNDGAPGCYLDPRIKQWLIHREAIANFSPPPIGNPALRR